MRRNAAGGGVGCPYAGLALYEREQEDYFFGRDLDAAMIADSLIARPLSVLYGSSGVGKSSVLNVGLPKALKELSVCEKPIVFRRWFPTSSVMRWLRQQTLSKVGRKFLILDQFEELFLYGGVDLFVKALAAMLDDPHHDFHVLIALRDDALHRLDALRVDLPELLDKTRELHHLDQAAIREAIERPIEVYNQQERRGRPPVQLGTGFADRLIQDLREEQGSGVGGTEESACRIELPFLQLALTAVWEAEGGSDAEKLGTKALDQLGGVRGIAASHVETSLRILTRSDQQTTSKILHYLVTPSGGKIAYSVADLAQYAESTPERMRELLRQLSQNARLLRGAGQDRPQDPYSARFELFHDVLAKPALEWRARYLERGPFACLVDLFTGGEYELCGSGQLFGRLSVPADHVPGEVLSLLAVSRCHIVILSNNDILDLRSTNGTTVNANPLTFGNSARLRSGDLIVLASTAAFHYFSVEDADKMQTSATEHHWGALIDGTTRRVRYLAGSELYLGLAADGGVEVVPAESQAFGTVHHRTDARTVFAALTDEPKIHGVWMQNEFGSVHHPLPAGNTWDLHTELTGIFIVDDRRFQIVLNQRALSSASLGD
jgi:hypothetical protein